MLKRLLVLCSVMSMMLVGCAPPPVYNQTEGNVADVAQHSNEAFKKSDALGKTNPALLINQGLYVDKTPISLAKDPSWTRQHIELRGDQLPFSYYSRAVANGGSKDVLTHYQVGLDQATQLSMNYSGTVKGALDVLAAKTGFVYTVNGNSVYWQSVVTKSFDIAFMPGAISYNLGDAGSSSSGGATVSSGAGSPSSGSGSGGSSSPAASSSPASTAAVGANSSSSSLSGAINLWTDLQTTVQSLLSKNGKVIVSQATTSITVTDTPSNIELVGKYINNLNKNLSKQVLVKVQVYEVTLNSDFNMGIDWQIIKRGFMGTNFVLNANYGTPVSITPMADTSPLTLGGFPVNAPGFLPQAGVVNTDPNHITGINLLVSALQEQGKVSVVSEPRVVCLNNQVSVIKIVDSQGYAASVSSSTVAGGTGTSSITSTITPGNLSTGLTLYVLPKIMHNKVYLQVNADLSSFLALQTFTSGGTGSGSASIQTPHITDKQFNQRSVIGSGDTMILSGFRQISNQTGAMQLFDSQALGGRASTQNNAETVVLITPIILKGTV